MNRTAAPSKPGKFPTFRRFCRAVFSRYTLFGMVVLVTLFALFHAVENWRGNRAWRQYEREIAARGETLDFQALAPKPVPDDQNAALTPVFASVFPRQSPESTNDWPVLAGDAQSHVRLPKDRRGERDLTDVVAWNQVLAQLTSETLTTNRRGGRISPAGVTPIAATDRTHQERAEAGTALLKHLSIYDPRIEELRASFRKSGVRFPVNYDTQEPYSILIPHLARIKSVVQVLQLRVSAELAAGQTNAAFEDTLLMIKVTEALRGEPFLISQLVRIACLSITAQAVWEGLAERKWNDAQLAALQKQFAELHLLESVAPSLHFERAAGVLMIENMRKRTDLAQYFVALTGDASASGSHRIGNLIASLIPDGWFQFEKVNHGRLIDSLTPQQTKVVLPAEVDAHAAALEADLVRDGRLVAFFKHRLMARYLVPALGKVQRRFSQGQVVANQIVAACALERYRIKHGEYPANLSSLTPEFLGGVPIDVLSGEPLKYRRQDDGSFTLHSIGWNGTDDNGTPGSTLFDDNNGDWVWHVPAPPPSAR